jgi:hypothetical protein
VLGLKKGNLSAVLGLKRGNLPAVLGVNRYILCILSDWYNCYNERQSYN